MHLSVIIPTHNRCEQVQQSIDSVLGQTYVSEQGWRCGEHFQIIVVDDGSTDATRDVLANSYPHITVLSQHNQGVSSARNSGISLATGEWLAFLDSDDTWLPTKLSEQFKALKASTAQVCHTEEIWLRNGVRVNPKQKYAKHAGMIYPECVKHCAMAPSSVIVHRSVLDVTGLFDPQLKVCEDYDLWLRICASYPVGLVAEPQVIRAGGHSDQLSTRYWGMDRYRVMGLEKILLMAASQSPQPWLLTQQHLSLTRTSLLNRLNILKAGARKHNNQQLADWVQSKLSKWANATDPTLKSTN